MPDHVRTLELVSSAIDGHLEDMTAACRDLAGLRASGAVVSEVMVERLVRLYSDVLRLADIYEEDLARWGREAETPARRAEVERVVGQLPRFRAECRRLLALAEKLRPRPARRPHHR